MQRPHQQNHSRHSSLATAPNLMSKRSVAWNRPVTDTAVSLRGAQVVARESILGEATGLAVRLLEVLMSNASVIKEERADIGVLHRMS